MNTLDIFVETKLSGSLISHSLKLLSTEIRKKISSDIKGGSLPHYGRDFDTISILGVKKLDKFLPIIVDHAMSNIYGR